MQGLGRALIVVGVLLVVAGLWLALGARRLPGDIVIRGRNSVFYFPLATCLILSLVLSLALWLAGRLGR